MSISEERRNELIRLACTPHLRKTQWSKTRPTKWLPRTVPNPADEFWGYYTNDAAWELIVDRLKVGHPVDEISLDKPPGTRGYVLRIPSTQDEPEIYVKLEIHRGYVWGRSFHQSEKPQTNER